MFSSPTEREYTVPFPPGPTLLLYTDGLTEARNRAGDFYDPAAGLTGRDVPGPDALLDTLLTEANRHARGRIDDDMALLAVTRTTETATEAQTVTVTGTGIGTGMGMETGFMPRCAASCPPCGATGSRRGLGRSVGQPVRARGACGGW